MSWSRRLRTIAISQIGALKDRLDRIDEEAALEAAAERRSVADARQELLDDPLRPTMGHNELTPAPTSRPSPAPVSPSPQSASPLARYYRVLGLQEGVDLGEIEATYRKLSTRCAADRFPDGSEEQKVAQDILARVEDAYSKLRDALNPTAGRFDKLEL